MLLKWLTSSKTEAFDNCVYETKIALFGSLSLEEFHLKTKKEIWENSKLCVSFIFFFITHHHIPQSKSLSRQVTKCADEAVITLMACSRNLIIEGFDSSRLRLLWAEIAIAYTNKHNFWTAYFPVPFSLFTL